ncbi:MAG: AAA family ATPase [Clostridiales bacterium]|nr:AAA family ATPase [Clostridiales bacterium]
MAASKITRHGTHVAKMGDRRILKGAFIFGANASGKSNLTAAIFFAQFVVTNGIEQVDLKNKHFRINKENHRKPGVFVFEFMLDDSVITYGFKISYEAKEILDEWLYKGDVCIFSIETDGDRKMSVKSGLNLKGTDAKRFKVYCADITGSKMRKTLFLSDVAKRIYDGSDTLGIFKKAREWFDKIHVMTPDSHYHHFESIIRNTYEQNLFGHALNYFDTGINGVSIDYNSMLFDHGNRDDLFEAADESHGTLRLMNLLPLYYAAGDDRIFVIDELDQGLHSMAVITFIKKFYEVNDTQKSQLIATTHDTSIMDLDYLRQDEIWFVERKADHSSRIYSLDQFRIRYDKKVEKDYLAGNYGAIPAIDGRSAVYDRGRAEKNSSMQKLSAKQKYLLIGADNFREIRECNKYYADKTLIISDFIQYGDEVTIITRPKHFGKTLNMTMIREFFDITKDSKGIFDGLAIMNTDYADQINSRPVLYFTFNDCGAKKADQLLFKIANDVLKEYSKYNTVFKDKRDKASDAYFTFDMIFEGLRSRNIDEGLLAISIEELVQAVYEHYKIKPIVLIDEYDQPILCAAEHGYLDELKAFFSGFYGGALKRQDCVHQALLTGIQRVAKESVFSQISNLAVYTVMDEPYSRRFGLMEEEAEELLRRFGCAFDEPVKKMYGYQFGKEEVYFPLSVLKYAIKGKLENYRPNTFADLLLSKFVSEADDLFHKGFNKLVAEGVAEVSADLTCSFVELAHGDTLWGLFINSGYLTVVETELGAFFTTVRIPNGEARSEFIKIMAYSARVNSWDIDKMYQYLLKPDLEGFMDIYRELVLSCTNQFAEKEEAYHKLFLCMCLSLSDMYKTTSNIKPSHGCFGIRLESLSPVRPHILIEFKEGEDVDALKGEALVYIFENQRYAGLEGECMCIGVAHSNTRCSLASEGKKL